MTQPANEIAIDWIWSNHNKPSQMKCYVYPINDDVSEIILHPDRLILRGGKTGNQCAVEAIKAARAGNRTIALRWLMAGQCHNDDAQRDIHDAGNASIDYAVNKYGNQVS